MDYTNIILTCCFVMFCHAAHIPEVYESNSQKQQDNNYEQPPAFNYQAYQKGTQFDPQRVRYQQQQQIDQSSVSNNRKPKSNMNFNRPSDMVTLPTRMALEDLEKESPQIPKGKIAKKSLKPNSYLVTEDAETSQNRQDEGYINYVERQPKVIQQNLGGFVPINNNQDPIQALSSLLGQSPENQLQGLQQLLNDNSASAQGSQGHYYKDHTPIKEDMYDYPNTQNKPNIKVHQNHKYNHDSNNQVVNQALQSLGKTNHNGDALKSLQAQLDVTASAHAENIIAQAQKKALEHVKAQHEAIARAQKAAEQAALEQINAQNEALTREHERAQAEAEAKQQEEAKQKEEKRKAIERRRQAELARERARIATLAYKHKQEQAKKEQEQEAKENGKDEPHKVAQATRIKNSQKHQKFHLAEPAETQHHYFTAPTASHYHAPEPVQLAYHQPAVHSTAPTYHHQPIQTPQTHYEPHKKYNEHDDHAEVSKYYVPPQFTIIGHTKNEHGEPEYQYAANYEFGYRIRDYDHGNDYGHKETKDGETTKGEYHALLPDGRLQTVTYYVDDSGYHAEVSYGAGESTGTHH